MNLRSLACAGVFSVIALVPGYGGQGLEAAEVVTGGSNDVSVGGDAAARAGDTTSGGTAAGGSVVTGGSSNVFINGKPAATAGDTTGCGGVIVSGNTSVMVNGKPLATNGGSTTDCAGK